ncbi:MAG: hypothetical protein WA966_01330 [Ornithinimicrobium sp.]
MNARRSVDQWRADVYRAPISPNVRLLLVWLGEHMDRRSGKVSIPREAIMAGLGWERQRVAERLKLAVDSEFLTRVSPGYTGRTAVYQRCWPSQMTAKRDRKNRALPRDQKYGRFTGGEGPENTVANRTADLLSGARGRDVSRDEKAEQPEALGEVTACGAHGWSGCPESCIEVTDDYREVS